MKKIKIGFYNKEIEEREKTYSDLLKLIRENEERTFEKAFIYGYFKK